MYMILTIIMISMMSIIIPMLIYLINKLLSMKMKKDREKMYPFECGFDQITPPQLPFSIQFFLISLMFLIFDIEIMLMLPIIKTLNNMTISTIMTFIMFIMILMISLWYEWMYNYLKWI